MHARETLRAHPLDGAMLYFQPATGLSLRVVGPETAGLRRTAPRVVMFGPGNACDLRCGYCSREVDRPGRWSLEDAAALLEGLAAAGTLEVAFGGGEPLLWPELLPLLRRLHATTALALNLTTNGTRLDDATADALAPLVGIVRLSIHADNPWRAVGARLAARGVRWGANVLVRPADLDGLPVLLADLADLGAADASLLAYVGPEPAGHLDADGDRRLSAVIRAAPLPIRASVCFGDRLDVPLARAGDCGAGRDFLTITPQGAAAGCSFQAGGTPVRTAAEALSAWSAQVAAPAPRRGCARPSVAEVVDAPRIEVWRGFSGNNSGECVMVARFAEVADAERYLAELLPGFTPGEELSAAWRALFAAEGLLAPGPRAEGPSELLAVGRSVLALGYDAVDQLAELRALAWRRGAAVEPGGIHLHELSAVLAVAGPAPLPERPGLHQLRHGALTFGAWTPGALSDAGFGGDVAWLRSLGRPFAVTIIEPAVDADALVHAAQRLGQPRPLAPRAALWFGARADAAAGFAAKIDGVPTATLGPLVLIDGPPARRTLLAAYRKGASVSALSDARLKVSLWFARRDRRIDAALHLPGDEVAPTSYGLRVVTAEPARLLAAARALQVGGLTVGAWMSDADPLGLALRRLREDLKETA